ncbi:microsomal glutathione S-transferase 1-like isoform X1 [Corticium candelabrum]|uniref:microsomal glutathione S-transferase 1-like isoform X1 n=1 Tax=Corticium candelabrum TaxID=121492 RepID=UPI002E25BC6B|nr:microsomal glutathione S-transferase 1-like isoform X1 [Corticium candelabrum]
MARFESLSFDNPVFAAYAFYAALLVAKMVFVQFCIIAQRMARGVPGLPEDVSLVPTFKDPKPPVNENVERVRRALINDLENIPTFLIISLAYVLTRPTLSIAIWHFRLFTVGRVMHTVAYLLALQPYRSIGFTISLFVHVSVVGQIIIHAL